MKQSEQISNLVKALVKAQKEIKHAHKDAQNPHYRNEYATLESVIDATKEFLQKNGLVIVQMVTPQNTLVTSLMHESGEFIQSEMNLIVEKNTMQAVGSAISYARRFSWAAICGVAQTDDDGEEASKPVAVKEAPKVKFRFQGGKFKDRNFMDVPQAEFDNYLEYLSGLTVKNKATLDTIAEMKEFKKQLGV